MGEDGQGHEDQPRLWPGVVTVAAVGTLPYLTLLAVNLGERIALLTLAGWWFVTLVLTCGSVLLVARWASRATGRRTAAVLAPLLLLFFRYPLVEEVARNLDVARVDTRLLWALVAAVVLALMIPISRRPVAQLYLAILGPALLLLPGLQLVTGLVDRTESPGSAPQFEVTGEPTQRPDIWLLVPDGYARADVVEAQTDVDMAPLLADLAARGFRTPSEATANYPITFLSIPAMLDMEYPVQDGESVEDFTPFHDRVSGDNAVVRTLRDWGYAFVQSPPAFWEEHHCSPVADLCIDHGRALSSTARALLQLTPLTDVLTSRFERVPAAQHSDPVRIVEQALHAEIERPKFVFAHLLNPHPPFLRDDECAIRHDTRLSEAAPQRPGDYGAAIRCLNQRLVSAIDRIMERDPDAVVVLQSDHGSGVGFSVEHALEYPDARFATFSAVRPPRNCATAVPDDLTPVNVFRLVLGCLTESPVDLVDDRWFMFTYARPEAIELTDRPTP